MLTTGDVENILHSRELIERNLLKKAPYTVLELAVYFEVPPSCIKKDLKNIGIEAAEKQTQKSFTIVKLKKRLCQLIKSMQKKNISENEILINFGLFRLPDEVDSKDVVERANALAKKGISRSDLKKYFKLTKNQELDLISASLRNSEVEKIAVTLVKNGASAKDVSRLTGFPKSDLEWVEKGKDVNHHYEYYLEQRLVVPSKKEKIDERRKAVLEMYEEGLSQKEIADKLSVSRITIGNDWRVIKKEDNTQSRRRNKNSL